MIKILYIGGVGPFGGASRSLYEAVAAFPLGAVEAYFIMPRGTALDFYRRVAADVIAARGISRFDHTFRTYYRGLRWLVVLRELAHLPPTLLALLRAKRRWKNFDLIHVNEFMEIVPGLIAKALFGAPLIVHSRALMRTDPGQRRTQWLHRRLRESADAVIAIDENVRATLPRDVAVEVIHNGFNPAPSETPDQAYLARLAGLRPSSLKIGFVGNLLRSKGLTELFEAAKILKAAGEDVQFLIVGGKTATQKGLFRWLLKKAGFAQNMATELEQMVAEAGLGEDFLLLGATPDIQRVYRHMDVLAFPTRLDAPGRPVLEAAFYSVPSIVAVRTPRPDTLVDGETGIAIPEPDPTRLADAIRHFARSREEVRRMGENARALAERNFRPEVNAGLLLDLYRRVLARTRPDPLS